MNFSNISEHYDAFLCDLWGVIHDGDELYPGVLTALEELSHKGKKLVFLSNAPRLAETVTTRMDAMGVKREWYHGAVTSGAAAVSYLNSPQSRFAPQASYYYLGLEKDAALLDFIPQKRVYDLTKATFFLNGNFEELGQTYSDIEVLVNQAAALKLPMLCINPDLEVTKIDGAQILCAGYIAEKYQDIGGVVEFVGKPYDYIYQMGMQQLGNSDKSRILMIGDNVLTDIKGANQFGIDALFITQGILQSQKTQSQSAEDYCQKSGVSPRYITRSL